MKKLYIYLAIFISALALASCAKEEKQVKKVSVKEVKISGLLNGIQKGENKQLVAYIIPSNAQNKEVEWTSSADAKIRVDKNGIINALGNVGDSAEITATSKDNGKSYRVLVRITEKSTYKVGTNLSLYLPVTHKKTGPERLVIKSGEEVFVNNSVTPLDATDKNLSWSSSDENIAIVKNGVITGIAEGQTTITAKITNLNPATADSQKTVEVYVEAPVPVTEIKFVGDEIYKAPGTDAESLIVLYAPQNASVKKVSLQSSDSSVAKIVGTNNDKVEIPAGAEYGSSATITATLVNSLGIPVEVDDTSSPGAKKRITATTKLIVVPKPIPLESLKFAGFEEITNPEFTLTQQSGTNTRFLRVNRQPLLTTERSLEWTTSDPSVATVDQQGNVTSGSSTGNATITATSVDKPSKSASIKVKVIVKPIYIANLKVLPEILSSTKLTDATNPAKTISIIQIGTGGDDVTHPDMAFISEDSDIASVETQTANDGTKTHKVSLHKYGTTKIWAISDKGITSANARIEIIDLNKQVDTTASAEDQAKQLQVKRSLARVAINAKNKEFPNFDPATSTRPPKGNTKTDFVNAWDWNITGYNGVYNTFFKVGRTKVFPDGLKNPQTKATIDRNFEIGQTSVTYRLWETVYVWATTAQTGNPNKRLADGGPIYEFKNRGEQGASGEKSGSQNIMYGSGLQPVTRISWEDAVVWSNAYTEWLNANEGTNYKPVYYKKDTSDFADDANVLRSSIEKAPGVKNLGLTIVKHEYDGIRLASQKEWEFAATLRDYQAGAADVVAITDEANSNAIVTVDIGTKTYAFTRGDAVVGATTLPTEVSATNFTYSEATKYAYLKLNTVDINKARTQDVGTITADTNPCNHPFKLCDMSGNLHEWVDALREPVLNKDTNAVSTESDANRAGYTLWAKYNRTQPTAKFDFYMQGFKSRSYFYFSSNIGIGYRSYTASNNNSWPDIGFRIARTLPDTGN